MRSIDEDALICDFAQYYHVYDIESVPAIFAGILAFGLPNDSRIKLKMAELRHGLDVQLNALLLDQVTKLLYILSDRKSRGDIPPSVYNSLMKQPESETRPKELQGFETVKDFELARQTTLKLIREDGEVKSN